jgi:hypothetical protein
MGGRIIALGLVGWSGIIALAWWLADQRIDLCDYDESGCVVRTTAARDFVLVFGLSVALIVMIGAAFVWVRRGGSFNSSRVWPVPTIENAKRMATLRGKEFAFPFAKASIPFVLVLAAIFGFVVYRQPAPKPASAADAQLTPVDRDSFSDLAPPQPEASAIEDNYDVAADRLEAIAEATARQVENETLPTKRAPASSRLSNRVYSIGTGAAPNEQAASKLEGPEYTMNADETLVTDD